MMSKKPHVRKRKAVSYITLQSSAGATLTHNCVPAVFGSLFCYTEHFIYNTLREECQACFYDFILIDFVVALGHASI